MKYGRENSKVKFYEALKMHSALNSCAVSEYFNYINAAFVREVIIRIRIDVILYNININIMLKNV